MGTGFSHLVIQTGSLTSTVASLAAAGFATGPLETPGGAGGPVVAWVTDPDGYRVELTQWSVGRPAGMTTADFDG